LHLLLVLHLTGGASMTQWLPELAAGED